MTMTTATPAKVSLEQAAAAHGISTRTLYRLRGAGRLTLYKRGSRTVVDPAEVAAALEPVATGKANKQ
jgi:hypothetical protein